LKSPSPLPLCVSTQYPVNCLLNQLLSITNPTFRGVGLVVVGLVVGSVQSGKTSNFNAVINSCVDLGYNLIIVLSGISSLSVVL
jgi:hypothetical protein